MEYEEARDLAKKSGGTVDWSEEKGWYVKRGAEAEPVSALTRASWMFGAPPWRTETGEGFLAPWQSWYQTPEGRYTKYQYGMPQLTWAGQQELGRTQTPIPSWMSLMEPTQAQRKAAMQPTVEATEEDEIAKLIRQLTLEASQREAAMWAMGVPGGGEYGQLVTLADGTTGYWIQDPETGVPTFMPLYEKEAEPETITEYQRAMLEAQQREEAREAEYNTAYLAYLRQNQQLQRDLQEQQLEAERQARLAQLAANPMSWLQYGLESGLGSQVQPWMVPLSQGGLQAGQQLTAGTETSLSNLPQLIRPSAQYWARMMPSQQAQYQGYEQARTGMTPEDVTKRLWMTAPPSGRFYGLSYAR